MTQSSELDELISVIRNNSYLSGATRHRAAELLRLLQLIHGEVDGQEFSADTAPQIVDYMEAHGLSVAAYDPEPDKHCERCHAPLEDDQVGRCEDCLGGED